MEFNEFNPQKGIFNEESCTCKPKKVNFNEPRMEFIQENCTCKSERHNAFCPQKLDVKQQKVDLNFHRKKGSDHGVAIKPLRPPIRRDISGSIAAMALTKGDVDGPRGDNGIVDLRMEK